MNLYQLRKDQPFLILWEQQLCAYMPRTRREASDCENSQWLSWGVGVGWGDGWKWRVWVSRTWNHTGGEAHAPALHTGCYRPASPLSVFWEGPSVLTGSVENLAEKTRGLGIEMSAGAAGQSPRESPPSISALWCLQLPPLAAGFFLLLHHILGA